MTVHRWERSTREEIAAIAPGAVTVLPVAAVEQHGPHLATGTDTAIVDAVLDRALALCATETSVLRTPTLWAGASDHHLPFGGTLSLSTETFAAVVTDLLRSLVESGCRRVLVLNGHGGNDASCRVATADAARVHAVTIATASYWHLAAAPEGMLASPGHAGQFETSAMLAIDESLVREELVRPSPARPRTTWPDGVHVTDAGGWERIDGFTDDPRRASADTGRLLLESYAEAVAVAIDALAVHPIDPEEHHD